MKLSEEQIRRIAKLKDGIQDEIRTHQEKIETLQDELDILDTVLKGSSFTKASSMMAEARREAPVTDRTESKRGRDQAGHIVPQDGSGAEPGTTTTDDSAPKDHTPIKNPAGHIMAKAYVTADHISIVLEDGMELNPDMPPFKTFFLDRIIAGMKKKDTSETDAGRIQADSVIDCTVRQDGQHISEIIIKNYRLKDRVGEIINTAGWSLARMLEKTGKH